jgi:hypothetical protein
MLYGSIYICRLCAKCANKPHLILNPVLDYPCLLQHRVPHVHPDKSRASRGPGSDLLLPLADVGRPGKSEEMIP